MKFDPWYLNHLKLLNWLNWINVIDNKTWRNDESNITNGADTPQGVLLPGHGNVGRWVQLMDMPHAVDVIGGNPEFIRSSAFQLKEPVQISWVGQND